MTAPPGPATPYGVYRAAYVDRAAVTHTVVHADGDPGRGRRPDRSRRRRVHGGTAVARRRTPRPSPTLTRRMPLGCFVHARSGDKGGDANLGLWVAHDDSGKYADAGHLADRS